MADADRVIEVALAQVGKPYVWNKAGPNSFDCSGLVVYAYKQGAGIDLPHFTGALWTKGSQVKKADLAPGDLVFPSPSHVAIYLGNNQMVSAPTAGKNVKTGPVYAFWGARRIIAPGSASSVVDVDNPLMPDSVEALVQVFKDVNVTAAWLTNGNNWRRILFFLTGFVLFLIGISRWDNATSAVAKTAKAAKGLTKP